MKRTTTPLSDAARSGIATSPMLFPEHYVWIVFLAALDVLFTSMILHLGGSELNWLAAAIIAKHDLRGMVIFKFILIALAVLTMEAVGRRNQPLGEKVARMGVILASAPVIIGFAQLVLFARHVYAD